MPIRLSRLDPELSTATASGGGGSADEVPCAMTLACDSTGGVPAAHVTAESAINGTRPTEINILFPRPNGGGAVRARIRSMRRRTLVVRAMAIPIGAVRTLAA